MDFDFRTLSRQLVPMISKMKVVKGDNNVTNSKHNETNGKVDETEVNIPQNCSNFPIET